MKLNCMGKAKLELNKVNRGLSKTINVVKIINSLWSHIF